MQPSNPLHIAFIGLRGSGKTTVARQLAALCSRALVELDDLVIDSFFESTVQEIWRNHGEAAWRLREAQCAHDALHATDPSIISMGGGTPMIQDVSVMMQSLTTDNALAIVYLRYQPHTLVTRLKHDSGDRPPLTNAPDMTSEINDVFVARDAAYTDLATVVLEGDVEPIASMTPTAIARHLSAQLDVS